MNYGYRVELRLPFDDVVDRVRQELAEQGFGVLTTIDVAATLREKLGIAGEPYLILGACNPPLAHRALEIEPSLGLLLPCNVVVRRQGDTTVVEILDPAVMVQVAANEELGAIAAEAARRLDAVRTALQALP
ncbi:MAG: DUF302 domain-containing protein [Acidothermus sp.]|nr:DUF302 domain-containing protein [Acidothermus sp.]MCL6538597.1 DUF302 domain-containing protein [Acidothermus sp.]